MKRLPFGAASLRLAIVVTAITRIKRVSPE